MDNNSVTIYYAILIRIEIIVTISGKYLFCYEK